MCCFWILMPSMHYLTYLYSDECLDIVLIEFDFVIFMRTTPIRFDTGTSLFDQHLWGHIFNYLFKNTHRCQLMSWKYTKSKYHLIFILYISHQELIFKHSTSVT